MPPNTNQTNSQPQPTATPSANTSPAGTNQTSPAKGPTPNPLSKLSPMKLIMGLATIFLILILAVALTHKSAKKTTTTTKKASQSAAVSITANSFVPQVLSLTVGSQVTWTNSDSKPHEVAADPYPKNDSIPGFDSTVILNKGDTVNFTFDKTGTYTYHDQLNPLKLKGTVVVK